jgi:hypothetical protein
MPTGHAVKRKGSGGKRTPRHPRDDMTLSELYHQGLPPTRAASVPSAAQSAINLSLMEPSFLQPIDSSWAPGM